jgi:hypothetical protein
MTEYLPSTEALHELCAQSSVETTPQKLFKGAGFGLIASLVYGEGVYIEDCGYHLWGPD